MSIPAAVEFDESGAPCEWTQLPPGPELAARLASLEWPALSDWELVDAMAAARRQATWAQALMLEGVGELARRRERDDPVPSSDRHRRICGEVSLELTVPAGQAEELVFLAETLPGRLPRTWGALRTGVIDYHRARVIADGLAVLDDELASRLEAELIGAAAEHNTTLLRRRLSRAVKKADPDAAAQRTKRARDQRRVELWDNSDDTCDLVGRHLSAGDAHAIRNRLTAAAHAMRADGDTRPLDHIRLDLFRDLLRGIPLPEATHHLITTPPTAEDAKDLDDGCPAGDTTPPGHDEAARPTAARPFSGEPAGHHAGRDAVWDVGHGVRQDAGHDAGQAGRDADQSVGQDPDESVAHEADQDADQGADQHVDPCRGHDAGWGAGRGGQAADRHAAPLAGQHADHLPDPNPDAGLGLAGRACGSGVTDLAARLLNQPFRDDANDRASDPRHGDSGLGDSGDRDRGHDDPGGGHAAGAGRGGRPERARRAAGMRAGPDPITAQVERQIARALADAADERLTGVVERARAEGRLDGMARMVGEAVEAMRDALDPLIDSWCRATSQTTGLAADERGQAPHGHDGYRPPAALQRLLQQRHATCVYPSCHRRSWRCDLDHTKPYDKGGRTCPCNMAPLCRAHHRVFKQHWQWKLIQLWPGLLIWVAPAGTWHIVLPE
jgi:hypothetical protein